MASQGSDKLKAILAAAQEKARAAQAAAAAESAAPSETKRVEALLDRNEALPDPRALARLYREKTLVERLPEDEEQAVGAAPAPAPAPAAPAPAPEEREVYRPPATAAVPKPPPVDDRAEPKRPPLSPSQIREVMNELQAQFPSGTYQTFEAKPLPEDHIPLPELPEDETAEVLEEPREIFYILGTLIALVVIAVFVLLALNGPLRYRPPAGGATPSPSASVKAR